MLQRNVDEFWVRNRLMPRLFDDKLRDYTKPAHRAESTYSFLDRTSLPEFARVRDMLERWIQRIPVERRKSIVSRMRSTPPGSQEDEIQFNAAFFELFLHEFLLGTEGKVAVEPTIYGLTPDFGVTEELSVDNHLCYVVEAKDIDLERGTNLERDWKELSVLDALDEIDSPDFRLYIQTEGKLDSHPPKAYIRRAFEELLSKADYEGILNNSETRAEFSIEDHPSASLHHGNWRLVGHLIPVQPEYRGAPSGFVMIGPTKVDNFDDIGRTKDRLYDKAKRYRNVENLIIALRCDVANNRLGEVLFGSQQVTVYFHKDLADTTPVPEPHYSQKLNGFWFNSGGAINRHVIGVAAFYGVHPCGLDCSKAVFYSNPYLDISMPEWTKMISHAEYSDGDINVVDGVAPHTFLKDWETVVNPFC